MKISSEDLKTHSVVFQSDWLEARKALLQEEKEFMRLGDRLSDLRRKLPWVKVEKDYRFHGPEGEVSLSDLFDGRSQLILQHFMFGPDWEEGCVGCSFAADHVDPARIHFQQKDVSYVAVSRAPYEKLAAFKQRMGWKFCWVSSLGSDFNYDYGVSVPPEQMGKDFFYNYTVEKAEIDELPGVSVFYKAEDDSLYHTYSTYGRGQELMDTAYAFLDIVPKGRDEDEQAQPGSWWRHHDRYDANGGSCCCKEGKSAEKAEAETCCV